MNDKSRSMKLSIIILILIVFQGISIMKMGALQRRIDINNEQLYRLSNQMRDEMAAFHANVDKALRQEASPIEVADASIGSVNKTELTVPITFTLTPKEVSENTTVYLDLDGETFTMEKEGTTFTATIVRDIFGSAMPKVVIADKGVKKTTQDNQVGIPGIKEMVFPIMAPRFSGGAKFGGGIYSREGMLSADIKESSSGVNFMKALFLVEVDGQVLSCIDIPLGGLGAGYEINEEVQLNDGHTCTMNLVAIDSIGLEHHYNVDHWVAGSKLQREPWFGDEKIYTSDGELLWELGIQPLNG